MPGSHREFGIAVLVDRDGLLLLQLRDDIPTIAQPGKIGLFGGHREGSETLLQCTIRELAEETGRVFDQSQVELLLQHSGRDWDRPDCTVRSESYLIRDVERPGLHITEGTLFITPEAELTGLKHRLTPSAVMALEAFRKLRHRSA